MNFFTERERERKKNSNFYRSSFAKIFPIFEFEDGLLDTMTEMGFRKKSKTKSFFISMRKNPDTIRARSVRAETAECFLLKQCTVSGNEDNTADVLLTLSTLWEIPTRRAKT